MKLVRHGAAGAEKPGLIDAKGQVRDLSAHLPDLTPEWLSDAKLAQLRAIDVEKLPVVKPTRFGTPVSGIRQCVAIGLNYRKHAAEAGLEPPKEPIVFFKAITSICGPNDDTMLPKDSTAGDWEIELTVVMGKTARSVSRGEALDYVAGYTIANDVSERDWQIKRSGQWSKGKSFDTFCPLGPWLVTRDEVDPNKLDMQSSVNGVVKQSESTSDLIFDVATVISHVSEFMTLLPGDVILTGTPSGVGLGFKPPQHLKDGDVVNLRIEGLGEQTQHVKAFKG
ncbi:MAG: fumarylacetoacetate hydrolase family protein [Variovorax sp.]